jgi:hypothetical protein
MEKELQKEAINSEGDVVPFGSAGTEGDIELDASLPEREKYAIALKITCPVLAKQYFEACVKSTMLSKAKNRKEAEAMELTSLLYAAMKAGPTAVERVIKLYDRKPTE